MSISCSIPSALNSAQVKVVFRDVCRYLNSMSPSRDREIAQLAAPCRLVCEGWNGSPEWMRSAELYKADGEVKLHLNVESGVAHDDIKVLTDKLTEYLSSLFIHPVQPYRTRVFCIGWSKTGMTSITEALRILGLFSWHAAPWVIGYKHVCSDTSQFRIDFASIAEYTAVSDLPICALYQELDEAFPGSLFIHTTRPLETWITSAIAAVEGSIKQYGCMYAWDRWAFGTDTIDIEVFQKRYLQHQEQVLDYFSGRSDFLAIDITRGDSWQKLCEFLQLPVPQVPFPHLNHRMIG